MKKIAVVHYQPLEYYPPVTNFLDVASKNENLKMRIWTTHNLKKRKVYVQEEVDCISRNKMPNPQENAFTRLRKYMGFNLRCLIGLVFFKPDRILYFETYSVWPVYMYLRFFNKKAELFIHYHEYFNPQWYHEGMKILKVYHRWEINFLYKKALWISQTNKDRIQLFLEDYPKLDSSKMKILPNFPPGSWSHNSSKAKVSQPLLTVYIGTLTLEHSYLKEYCQWVMSQNGKVIFDIYGFNYNAITLSFLKELDSPFIRFFEEGVDYKEIPLVLKNYDVGLILYTAQNENFKYNASNKLFEYLVCGLQVWYSDRMLGIQPYENLNVVKVDFDNINDFEFQRVTETENCLEMDFTAEAALEPIINKLVL